MCDYCHPANLALDRQYLGTKFWQLPCTDTPVVLLPCDWLASLPDRGSIRLHGLQVKAQYQSTNKFADASGTISSFTIAPECGYTAAVAGR